MRSSCNTREAEGITYPPQTRYELDRYEDSREPDVRVNVQLVEVGVGRFIRRQVLAGDK